MLLIMCYMIFYSVPQALLSWLQYTHVKKKMQQKALILSEEEYRQAGAYTLDREKLKMCESVLDLWIVGVCLGFCFAYFETNDFVSPESLLWQKAFYVWLVFLGMSAIKVPLDAYQTFIIDKKYGFFKGNWRIYLSDQIKSLVLFFVFGYTLILSILFIFEHFPYWWLYAFIFFFGVVLIINLVYPTLIAPFFNRFTPLEEGTLKDKINALMNQVGFLANGIYVVDASRRDGRLNAYFGGLGKSKRVVLFDTLVQKVNQEQLLAILGHELGHFKHHDLYKGLLFTSILLFSIFFLMAHIPISVFEILSLQPTSYNYLLLIMIFSNIIIFWAMPLMGVMSRHNEYQADAFGASLESKEALIQALLVLVNENKSFPSSHPFHIIFYHTHPPLLERLKALGYHEN